MNYTAIVDYGVGNLKSVVNAMNYVGRDTMVTGNAAELERADSIILPGVGAFPDAADKLRETRRAASLFWGSAWECSCCSTGEKRGEAVKV